MEKRPWVLAGPPVTMLAIGATIRLRILGDELKHPLLHNASSALLALAGFWLVALVVNWVWSLRSTDAPAPPPDRENISHALFWLSDKAAWGRWFRLQQLGNNDQELPERMFMHSATTLLQDAVQRGQLSLWGVPSSGVGFEPISPELLQTRAALYVEADVGQLWRVRLGPYTSASPEIASALPRYDWLAVDMNQVRKRWPEKDRRTDREAAKLHKKYLARAGR